MNRFTPVAIATAALLASSVTFAETSDDLRAFSPQVPFEFDVPDVLIPIPHPEEPDVEIYTSGAHYFKRALTSTKPRTTRSEKFLRVPGAATRIVVPAGLDVLVNVAFTAESRCNDNDPNSALPNWCEVRILVDGAEAAPAASSFPSDTYAFDSTDAGTESSASWESHAMDRHRCVFNRHGNTAKVVPIEVQWKVTDFGGAPNFWLDDWSFTVELARGCRRDKLNLPNIVGFGYDIKTPIKLAP